MRLGHGATTTNFCTVPNKIIWVKMGKRSRFQLGTFYQHNALESIILYGALTVDMTIWTQLFQQCASLTGIVVPKRVVFNSTTHFDTCYSLRECVIPVKGSLSIPPGLINCNSLANLIIPDGYNSYADGAVTSATALRAFTQYSSPSTSFPLKLQYLYCMTKLVIPSTATTYTASAFTNCYSLSEFTFPPNTSAIPANMLDFRSWFYSLDLY